MTPQELRNLVHFDTNMGKYMNALDIILAIEDKWTEPPTSYEIEDILEYDTCVVLDAFRDAIYAVRAERVKERAEKRHEMEHQKHALELEIKVSKEEEERLSKLND